MAWALRPVLSLYFRHEDLGTGYLRDEIVVGIGIDEIAQGFVRVWFEDMLGYMWVCDGLVGDRDE